MTLPARGRGGAAVLSAIAALAALGSCAGEPAAPPASVGLSIQTVSITAVDLDSVRATLELRVDNGGPVAVVLGSLRLEAESDGAPLIEPALAPLGSARLEPGAGTAVPYAIELDAPAGSSPTIPLRLTARLEYSSPGGPGGATIARDCEFPRVMPPVMRIASIRILKDELINTKLGVDLEVENPNAFPLSFAELEYRLYGEGRYWASGSLARAFVAPALGTAKASLYLTMNFTDMSRSLLDQVLKLATVRYRLVGAGHIDTGLEFLPRFVQPFDMSGVVKINR